MERMDTRTDEALVAAGNDGDEAAFPILVERYLTLIYNFARRGGCDEHSADDVSQDVFIKAWKNLPRFNATSASFKTWLFHIARNTIIDFLRKKKHIAFSRFDTDDGVNMLEETVAYDAPLPDEVFAQTQDAAMIERALQELPYRAREVIMLRNFEDMTFDEIGQALGEPLNTVKSRHRRALASLRIIVEKHQNRS